MFKYRIKRRKNELITVVVKESRIRNYINTYDILYRMIIDILILILQILLLRIINNLNESVLSRTVLYYTFISIRTCSHFQ